MEIGHNPVPESPEEMARIHHALENPMRRRMIILICQGMRTVAEIAAAVGPAMLDYHLHRLELAGLIEVHEGQIVLTESGRAYGELVLLQKEKGGAGKL
jgi:DNA-binding transcriptional ArsR family regulator